MLDAKGRVFIPQERLRLTFMNMSLGEGESDERHLDVSNSPPETQSQLEFSVNCVSRISVKLKTKTWNVCASELSFCFKAVTLPI
jgi:hypothetical protein